MKRFLLVLCLVIALFGVAVLTHGSLSQIPSGTWMTLAPMNSASSGASAVLLQDGRILVTGGDTGNGPVTSADFFGTDGSVSGAPPLNYARSGHISVALQDGRILVTGGFTVGGSATSAAEMFDPLTNSWTTLSLGMSEARSGATAALLQDGRVLVAGGQNGSAVSSTIEIFDPTTGKFTFAGMMSSPRTQHAMAVLQSGNVMIVGGFNGTAAVASTDIFDPVAGTVSAGPSLAVARFGHSATTLLNAQVAVVGGNNGNANAAQMDVTPAELFDPTAGTFTTLATNLATPREGHVALLLPNNNSVLIAGGTSGGAAVASAELFSAQDSTAGVWTYGFAATGTMTTARGNAAGSANQVAAPISVMRRNGLALIAGGKDANGSALNSMEGFGYSTVQTDAIDYPPGTTVNITGSGWKPGETVTLQLVEAPLIDTHGPYTTVADANGNISDSSFVTDDHDLSIKFYLTATGSISQAQTTFRDNKSLTITFAGNGAGSVAVTDTTTPGDSHTCTGSPNPCLATTGNNDLGTLTATASTGSSFAGWSAQSSGVTGCAGNGCNFSMGNTGQSVTATFQLHKLAIISVNGGVNPTAGTAFSVVVRSQDGNGNALNVVTATGVTLSLNTGTGTLGGTLTGPILAGSSAVTISGVTYTKAEAGVVLTATRTSGDTLAPGNSAGFAVNVGTVAAGTSTVVANPTSVVADGASTSTVTVTLKDANGNPVSGKTVSLTAGSGSSTIATVSGTTNASGQATFTAKDSVVESVIYTSKDTADNITVAQTATVNFTVGTPTAGNSTVTANPTSVTADGATTSTITIIPKDASNRAVSGKTVTLAQGAGSSTISAASGPSDVNGVVTFTVKDTVAQAVTYTATDTTDSATITQTAAVTFTAGAPTAGNSTVTANPTSVTANGATTSTITVTINDAHNNPVSGKTVTLAQGAGSSTISAASGPSNASGVVTFAVNDTKAETVTYTATDTSDSVSIAQTAQVTFTAGALDHFTFTNISNPQTAGTAFNISITAQDAFNNTVTSFTGNGNKVNLTSTGTLVGAPITTNSFTNGVLSGLSVTITNTGGFSLTATGIGANTKTGTSNAFTVNAAVASKLVFSQQPSNTIAGQAITPAVSVLVQDQFGNLETSDTSNVSIAISIGGVLSGTSTTTVGAVGGIATFSNLVPTKAGTGFTLSATYGSLTGATSGSFNVTAAAPNKLAFSAQPATTTYGSTFPAAVTVQILDQFGNLTSSTDSVSLAITSGTGTSGAALSGGAAVNAVAGVATFSNLSINRAGTNYTLTASSTSLVSSTSSPFNINQRAITVTAAANSKVYDGTTSAAAVPTITSGTLAPGDVGTFAESYDNKTVVTTHVLTPAGTVKDASNTDVTANYAITFTSLATGVITMRPITVTATGVDKPYDGTAIATAVTLSDNRVSGDAVTDSYTSASFVDKNVGISKTVNVAGISISGMDSGNYSLSNTTASTTANITAAHLTVTADDKMKTYDGAVFAPFTATITGFVNSENSSVVSGSPSFSGAATTAVNTGNYTITPALGSLSANNYDFTTFNNGTLTINQAISTTALAFEASPYVYRASAFTASATVTGSGGLSQAVSVVYSGDCTNVTMANGCTASANYAGDANHTASSDSESITITPAASTTAVTFEAGPYVYRGTAFAATAAVTGVGGLSQAVPVVYSGDCTNVTATNGCTATATYAGDTNHLGSFDTKSITITQAGSMTVVAVPGGATFTYDGNAHPATVSVTGIGGLNLAPLPVYSCVHAPISVPDSGCTASYTFLGDTNHTGSSGSQTYTISQAQPAFSNLSSPSPISYGDASITLSGTIAAGSVYPPTTESVTITINNVAAAAAINANGAFSTSFDTHAIPASPTPYTIAYSYSGDTNFKSASDSATSLTVNPATTQTTLASAAPSALGQAVTFIATVADTSTGDSAVPFGTVNFYEGTTLIGSAQLASGQASFTTVLLSSSASPHSMTAAFIGNIDFSASMPSAAVSQTVNPRNTTTSVSLNPATAVVGQQSTATLTVIDAAVTGPAGTPGAFALTAQSLHVERASQAAALLPNGMALIAGGQDASSHVLATVEIYDPVAGTFAALSGPGQALSTTRAGATATLLNNGRVLIVGGSSNGTTAGALASAEIFDPVAGTFSALTGSGKTLATARSGHTATLLPNGNVLIAGGQDSSGTALTSTEVYDPSTQKFSAGPGPLGAARFGHTSTLLPSGLILVAGGSALNTAELYKPADGTTTITGSLTTGRTNHAAALLPDGNVLIAGGTSSGQAVKTTELYNSVAGAFIAVGSMNTARSGLTATMLDSAQALLLGGSNSSSAAVATAETYTPSFDPLGIVHATSTDGTDAGLPNDCTLTLSGTGASTCQVTDTPANVGTGTHTISATYNPAPNLAHSGSNGSTNLTVIKADTSTTLASTGNPSTYGQSVTFTATVSVVSPGFGIPTGSVNLYDGGTCAAPGTTLASPLTLSGGTAGFSISTLSAAASPHSIIACYTGDSNFNATGATGASTTTALSQKVNKANATIVITPYSVTYDGTSHTATGTVTGVFNESLSGLDLSATTHTNAGDYLSDAWSFTDATGNYNSTSGTTHDHIDPRPATWTTNANSKTYGDADPSPLTTGSGSNFVVADNVTATYTRAAGESALGGPYHITATLNPASVLGNYTITNTGASFTINTRIVSVTPNAANKTYGDLDPALSGTLTNFVSGDGVTATYTRTTGETVAGSPYTISATLVPAGVLGNYSITYNTASFTINTRIVSVTPNAANKTYGTLDPPLTGTLTNFIAADHVTATYTRAVGETVAGSPYKISATLSPANVLGNYNVTYNTANFTISEASTTTSVTTSQTPTVYGNLVTFTATVTDSTPSSTGTPTATVTFLDGGTPIGTGTLSAGMTTFSTFVLPVGSNSITAVYGGDANFTGSTSNSLLQSVTSVPVVSISPDAVTFAPQDVNTTSVPMPVVLTNIGTAPLSISSIQISGNDSSEFTITSTTCQNGLNVLAAGASCTVNVAFSPSDTGDRMSSLVFTDNDGGSVNMVTQTIALTGSSYSIVSANFTKQPILANSTIWFNSVFSVKGPSDDEGHELDLSQNKIQIFVKSGKITFTSGSQPTTLNVPPGRIILDPKATAATTTFDGMQWITTVPSVAPNSHEQQFDVDGEIFATGLPWLVPAGGLPGGIKNVTWSASYTTDTPGLRLKWEWGAAVYNTAIPINSTANYIGLGVKPTDDQRALCNFQHSTNDHAATLENFKPNWVLGATGDDAGDYTGDWTHDAGVLPSAVPVSVNPDPLIFTPVPAGQSSATVPVTITNNNESLSAYIASVAVADGAEFNVTPASGPCALAPFTLAPLATCTYNVTFTPGGMGTSTGTILFKFNAAPGMDHDNAPSSLKLDMVGTGMGGTTPYAALSVRSLTFPRQEINTTSASQTVMLVNAGGAPLNISSIALTPASGEFAIASNLCGASPVLASGASCSMTVNFTPSGVGPRPGAQLTFTYGNNSWGNTQSVPITGSGSW